MKSPKPESSDPTWLKIAMKELGTREVRGGENPRIIEYHAATQLKATEDEVAWCSSFVNWVMMKAGYERTHSAAARSWLGYGEKLTHFKKGCIVVFKRGGNSWQGHVAFGIEDHGKMIEVLGGNQSDSVSKAMYKTTNVLGYFWPNKKA